MADHEPLPIKAVHSAQKYINEQYSNTNLIRECILGEVLLGTPKSSKCSKEVIKLCEKHHPTENPRMEIDFMSTICNVNHPNFVRFIEAVEDNELYAMRLEYISGGDMCTYLMNMGKGLTPYR